MSVRSLNKVQLIGNLTRDPELRYTPSGTAVCTFGLATNRSWTTQSGETKEETEFHRIVSWNKLAELCSQLLSKGRKIYVEGRLSTRTWTAQDNTQRTTTEIVIEDMIILDSKKTAGYREGMSSAPMGGGQVVNEAPVAAVPVSSPMTNVSNNQAVADDTSAKKT
ncbi:MAG TPA: single-stranded DNA-binding protein, partial [archaeon]|nr:single-stranded DNA-binding protein [archaeon]